MRGDPGTLGANRLLGDLDQDFLTFLKQFFNRRQWWTFFAGFFAGRVVTMTYFDVVFDGFHLVKYIGDIQESRLLQTDIDESCLHARQDPNDPATVDVADDTELTVAFNPDYLIAGIEAAPGDEVKLQTVDALKPAVLRATEGSDYLYLLMPVRVS